LNIRYYRLFFPFFPIGVGVPVAENKGKDGLVQGLPFRLRGSGVRGTVAGLIDGFGYFGIEPNSNDKIKDRRDEVQAPQTVTPAGRRSVVAGPGS